VDEIADDESFVDLVESVKAKGRNLQAVKVRPIPAEQRNPRNIPEDILYEEIWGFKRLQACKAAGVPVLCLIEELDDADAFSEMLSENKGRSQISAWTKAVSWNDAVKNDLMTIDDIASTERVKLETIEAYLRVLEIMDKEIIEKVKMHQLGIEALYELRSALLEFKEDSDEKYTDFVDRVIENADVIDAKKGTKSFISNLRAQTRSEGKESGSPAHNIMAGKTKMVSMKKTKRGYAVTFHKPAADALNFDDFEKALKKLLAEKGVKID
jgi:ParB/RepB/Spo0J family partition protein